MGRHKKVIEVDTQLFDGMSQNKKLLLCSDFRQLFHYELSKIPCVELVIGTKGKAEKLAAEYYRKQGYEVYHSKVNDGYRSVGVLYYWQEHTDKITTADWLLIKQLQSLLSSQKLEKFAYAVKDKNGTPDLLLIKNNTLSFVEVKSNYETVKHATIEFCIRYGEYWPISLLRIITKPEM